MRAELQFRRRMSKAGTEVPALMSASTLLLLRSAAAWGGSRDGLPFGVEHHDLAELQLADTRFYLRAITDEQHRGGFGLCVLPGRVQRLRERGRVGRVVLPLQFRRWQSEDPVVPDLPAEPSQRLELLRVPPQPPFACGGELRFG